MQAGVPSGRVFVAPNAVANTEAQALSARLVAEPGSVERWRRELGLGGRPVVLFVGRLIRPKRVDDLLRACSNLAMECDLLIVGDGPERSALESLAITAFPRARFLGHLEGSALARVFAVADLFVLPGTGGLAVHEAMHYGMPVVVGELDGTQSDLLQEGRNGCALPAGGIEVLANVIRRCLSDPEGLKRMGVESRRIATEEVSVERMVRVFVETMRLVAPGGVPGVRGRRGSSGRSEFRSW